MTRRPEPDTADRLIAAATPLFAARGFYGVSISAVADELGITKQALLHHFGSKEKLYSAVLSRIARRFEDALGDETDIVAVFEAFYTYSMGQKDDLALIARELLDNEQRADKAQQWFLQGFLQRLVDMAQAAKPDMSAARALAEIYVMIGAINYYAISGPTLRNIFGSEAATELDTRMPETLRDMAEARFR